MASQSPYSQTTLADTEGARWGRKGGFFPYRSPLPDTPVTPKSDPPPPVLSNPHGANFIPLPR